MDLEDNEHLVARIQQLERERDELRKDIEQLCMQQSGSSYLAAATRMHFQRTAGLEQEIENLKKKFAACTRENHNLQEELAEAYRIKSQLADLHSSEVAKNLESEKQLKFFQGCVAAAFAERDHSIMEAEKAKEKEESSSQKLEEVQDRVEELSSKCHNLRETNGTLRVNLAKQEERNEVSKQVINKFYEIRQYSLEGFEDISWDEKCQCLLDDPPETWSFNDTSTSRYINSLEEGLETMKKTVDNLQNKLRMGVEIEKHLKLKVKDYKLKLIRMDDMVKSKISGFCRYFSQYRDHILNLLDKEKLNMNSTIGQIEEKITQCGCRAQNSKNSEKELKADNDFEESTDAKMKISGLPDSVADENVEASEALALALHEKVSTLLLLSQQEERHLLERDVNAALQRKTEELQRNLLQVTHEKVKALMELAQVKQELHELKEQSVHDLKRGADTVERKLVTHEKEGKLKGLLKGTYLRRWVGTPEFSGSEATVHLDSEENCSSRKSAVDFARMKIENATLRESIESMEQLTTSIHRLRLTLLKVKESESPATTTSLLEALKDIINEAKLIKTALSSSLPISWSAEVKNSESSRETLPESRGDLGDSSLGKIDFVSAAGFEMVELLVFVAELLLKDYAAESGS